MKTLSTLGVSIVLLILSCQNDNIQHNCDGDNAQSLETFYFQEFTNIPCDLQNIDDSEKKINLIITNEADLEKYFSCYEQLPKIDFDKYMILSGLYRHHQCAIFESQQLQLCNNKIFYRVKMLEEVCGAITNVYYCAVIAKKYENIPVVFDLTFSN